MNRMTNDGLRMTVFKSPWGWMGLSASGQGLCAIVLPKPARGTVEAALAGLLSGNRLNTVAFSDARDIAHAGPAPEAVADQAQRQLLAYFAGRRKTLDVPIDFRSGSAFQRRVWRATLGIPYGRVRSYKWVASRVGGATYARAVGHALGANPLPILVPCHRVVAHDATLGGFTGGLQTKRRLLGLEGILQQLKQS